MLILNYRHFLVCSVVCSTQTFFWRLQRNHAKAKGLFQEQVQLRTLTFQLHYVFDMYLQSYEQLDSKNVKCYSPLQRLVPWQRHCEIEFHTDSLMIVHACNITKFTSQVKEVKAAFVGRGVVETQWWSKFFRCCHDWQQLLMSCAGHIFMQKKLYQLGEDRALSGIQENLASAWWLYSKATEISDQWSVISEQCFGTVEWYKWCINGCLRLIVTFFY